MSSRFEFLEDQKRKAKREDQVFLFQAEGHPVWKTG